MVRNVPKTVGYLLTYYSLLTLAHLDYLEKTEASHFFRKSKYLSAYSHFKLFPEFLGIFGLYFVGS